MDDVLKSKVDYVSLCIIDEVLTFPRFDAPKVKGFRWIVAYAFEVDGGMRGRYMYL